MGETKIIGNPIRFRAVEEWLRNFCVSQNGISIQSVFIVTGPHGIGKTTRIHEIVRECKRWAISIHPTNCHTSKDLADMVFKACNAQNLAQLFTIRTPGADDLLGKCIVIDEFETLIANDRNIASTLSNLIIKSRSLADIPVIIICDIGSEKKLADLRKSKNQVSLGIIDTPTLFLHFSEHASYKGVINDAQIHQACVKSNGNYVYALQLLDQFKIRVPPSPSTDKPKDKCKVRKRLKAVALGSAEHICVESLHKEPEVIDMFRCKSHTTILEVFLQDAWINPMRFHENLPTELTKFRKGTKAMKDAVYVKCLEHIILWDVCMSNDDTREGSTSWALENLAISLFTELSKLPRKDEENDNDLNAFTKILSQMSLQKKNDRMWYQVCQDNGIPSNLAFNVLHSIFSK